MERQCFETKSREVKAFATEVKKRMDVLVKVKERTRYDEEWCHFKEEWGRFKADITRLEEEGHQLDD